MAQGLRGLNDDGVVGDPADLRTQSLLAVAQRRFDPLRVLAWGPSGNVPLLEGRSLVDGMPAAYVCRGFICQAPVTDMHAFGRELTLTGNGQN